MSSGLSSSSTKVKQMFVCLSRPPSRQKLRERGRLDGLIWGGTAALATHDWEPRSPPRVHADAAIQHAQVQLMSSARAQAERMKEDNRGRGEGQRSGVKERGEDWWSGTVKNKENSEGSKTHEGTEAVPLPTSFPPFRSRLLSRTASHALHTHPHVLPPPPLSEPSSLDQALLFTAVYENMWCMFN